MISFPNCKINLGLNVLAKRSDGYHDLQTIFFPVPIEDVLEITQVENKSSFITTGLTIEGTAESNLCLKAYDLLKTKFDLPPVQIHLHKVIPTGAGLGGGSSDAAFTLKLLNDKFNLGLGINELLDLAALLGSDCPFFILNSPCYASGRGDILQPTLLSQLGHLFGVIVTPSLHISTAWAFQQIIPRATIEPLQMIIAQPIANWKLQLTNDFEQPVFQLYPELKAIKEQLYKAGAVYASLTGSGSALYGLFEHLPAVQFPSTYFVKTFMLDQAAS